MGAWKELIRYASEPKSKSQQEKEANFIYKGVFCKYEGKLKWQMAPHYHFLPRDLANIYRSVRGGIVNYSSNSDSSGSSERERLPSQTENTLIQAFSGDLHARQQAEELAEEILDQIVQAIARDVEEEDNLISSPIDIDPTPDSLSGTDFDFLSSLEPYEIEEFFFFC